jgi:hypothetical protein
MVLVSACSPAHWTGGRHSSDAKQPVASLTTVVRCDSASFGHLVCAPNNAATQPEALCSVSAALSNSVLGCVTQCEDVRNAWSTRIMAVKRRSSRCRPCPPPRSLHTLGWYLCDSTHIALSQSNHRLRCASPAHELAGVAVPAQHRAEERTAVPGPDLKHLPVPA